MSCKFQFTVNCEEEIILGIKKKGTNQSRCCTCRVQLQMSHFLSHWFVYESMFKIKPAVKCKPGSDVGHLTNLTICESCLQLAETKCGRRCRSKSDTVGPPSDEVEKTAMNFWMDMDICLY